jgi:nicotinamidase-related amidase
MTRALVIVDIQNDYFPGGALPLTGSLEAGRNASEVLSHFRKTEQPIVHIQHIQQDSDSSFFVAGSVGVEIHELVRPLAGETHFVKHTPNSFAGTPLLQHLRDLNVSELVVVGMMTHMCIDSTVRAAFDYGFSVELVGEACATYEQTYNDLVVPAEVIQATFLAAIDGTFATVRTVNEVTR